MNNLKRKNSVPLLLMLVFFISFSACEQETEIDKEKPTIDLSSADAFPLNCDTLYFGESFTLKMLFNDNMELGSYSVDIHHNFDGHSHSTEVEQCEMDAPKPPVNAYTFISDYDIAPGLKSYETSTEITLPAGNANGNFDEGDYHFFVSLTDKEGWSAQKGLSIKILHR